MIAKYLWEIGSFIIAIMGALHLRGTLFTKTLYPKNEHLVTEMNASPLLLTEKLTMWKSWIGFNATHSIGAIFIGIANCYLASRYFDVLRSDPLLGVFTIFAVGGFVWVSQKYWFKTITLLLSIALLCYVTSFVLMIAKGQA